MPGWRICYDSSGDIRVASTSDFRERACGSSSWMHKETTDDVLRLSEMAEHGTISIF